MKKKLLLVSAISLMMICSMAGCGGGSSEPVSSSVVQTITVEKVGTLSSDYEVKSDSVQTTSHGQPVICDYEGNIITDKEGEATSMDAWDDDNWADQDLYRTNRACKHFRWNDVGLIKADGTVLLNCLYGKLRQLGPRYIEVYNASALTTNESEAILSSSKDNYTYNASYGDEWYKGTIMVYDLVEERFVPNIKVDRPDTMRSEGNIIEVTAGNAIEYYNSDGELVGTSNDGTESQGSIYLDGSYFHVTDYDSGQNIIYDENMKELFKTEYRPAFTSLKKGYVPVYNEDSLYGALDESGEVVIPFEYDGIKSIGTDLIRVKKGDKYGIIDYNNNVIAEIDYDYISNCGKGYFEGEKGKKHSLFSADGMLVNGVKDNMDWRTLTPEEDNALYIVADQSYSLKLKYAFPLAKFIAYGVPEDAESYDYYLYETMTGSQLLDQGYKDFYQAYGYVYAQNEDGSYDIYEASYN